MSGIEEIYRLVSEIEATTARARADAAAKAARTIEEEIRPELGTVRVNGYGALLSIDLDQRNIQVSTEAVLAAAVVDAITRAESRANRQVGSEQ
ncbi:hypothetical protein [Actinokineospora iranica]|uniref:YbaB/EbfC DNA-binding family protein n=1 Tax=Actinokineospora iranica TaxID=1271860 RepID=A0A1G6QZU1_9PSEU|nr:hypothetical protein [Actinokineospora iranica]SDC97176.1 hypothetical protein SAMN05216174_10629 [Actinokineospora iranica]